MLFVVENVFTSQLFNSTQLRRWSFGVSVYSGWGDGGPESVMQEPKAYHGKIWYEALQVLAQGDD
jgi:hypothetical protein